MIMETLSNTKKEVCCVSRNKGFFKNTIQMNRILIIIPLILILIVSCDLFKRPNECEKIIEKEKMIDIMTDMYLMEAFIYNELELRTSTEKRDTVPYFYAGLFHKHNITKDNFHKAFRCYASDREAIDYINEEVLNIISIRHSKEWQKQGE